MKIFILFLLTSLKGSNLLKDPCEISYSNESYVTNYEDCQLYYSTSRFGTQCCYVKGADRKGNPISACAELRNTVEEALKDLDYLETTLTRIRIYYLDADCNFDKEISICQPDDRKSYTPLSVDYCSKYPVIGAFGVEKDSKCCYVTGINAENKNVYSCIEVSPTFSEDTYAKNVQKNKIKNGEFERLGALTNIDIQCAANLYSISIISFLFSILFL